MTKKEFAGLCGVTQGRVSQWIADGRIGRDALQGTGRSARIVVRKVLPLKRKGALPEGSDLIAATMAGARAYIAPPPPEACSEPGAGAEPSPSPEPGLTFLYLIVSDHGHVKVGYSDEPKKRLRSIRVGSSCDLVLAHVESVPRERARAIEQAAHLWLRQHRLRREWFAVDLVTAMRALSAAIDFIAASAPH